VPIWVEIASTRARHVRPGAVLPGRRRRLVVRRVLLIAAVLAGVVVIAAVLAVVVWWAGAQMVVAEKGSGAGRDVLLVRVVPPSQVRAGQLVTFTDPLRQGRRVTHRLVHARIEGSQVLLDAPDGPGVRRWSMATDGQVGVVLACVGATGAAVPWLTDTSMRPVWVVPSGIVLLAGMTVVAQHGLPRVRRRPRRPGRLGRSARPAG
jgi:hypothetical protein